jgi:hypothetical protein
MGAAMDCAGTNCGGCTACPGPTMLSAVIAERRKKARKGRETALPLRSRKLLQHYTQPKTLWGMVILGTSSRKIFQMQIVPELESRTKKTGHWAVESHHRCFFGDWIAEGWSTTLPQPRKRVISGMAVTRAFHANRWSSSSVGRTLVFYPRCETIFSGSPIVTRYGRRQSRKSVCASELGALFDRDKRLTN